MKITKLTGLAVLAGALVLSACSDSSQPIQNSSISPTSAEPSAGAAQALQRDVSFDLNFSALLEKELSAAVLNDFSIKALSANLMTGTMQVENLDLAQTESHEWTINLDESDLGNVQSLKTIVLLLQISVLAGVKQR